MKWFTAQWWLHFILFLIISFSLPVTCIIVMHIPNGFLKTFLQRTVKLFERRRKIWPDFSFSILFFLHCFHLLLFVIKLYKVTLITSYNRQTPSDQKVYKGARVSYSKCLQSKIVYVMFSCKNSLIRGKLHTLYLLGKKCQRKTGPKALVFLPREMFYWVRIKEPLSLNALRVADSVILDGIG